MANARNQITFVVGAENAERLRALAQTSVRDMRSLAAFALSYAERELRRDPEFAYEIARLAKQKLPKQTSINIVPPPATAAALERVKDLIDQASQMLFLDATLLRGAFPAWLDAHDDQTLLAQLGVPWEQTA